LQGVDVLMHVGSPLPGTASADVVLQSAIDGTRRVLEASLAARVKKVVFTSTFATLYHPDDTFKPGTATEQCMSIGLDHLA